MFARVVSAIKEFGAGPAVIYLADRVLQRISASWHLRFYELMVQPIPERPLLPGNLVKSLSFREIAAGDPELELMPAPAGVRAARFAQGSVCLGMFRKGELIGYSWFVFNRYAEDEARFDFVLDSPIDSVFDFDLYLFPEHRLGLGFAGLWHGVNEHLRARGIRYTFSRLNRFNLASRRAHEHLGWRRIGRAFVLQLGSVELIFTGLAPFIRLSLSPDSRMLLRLSPRALQAEGGGSLPAASAGPTA